MTSSPRPWADSTNPWPPVRRAHGVRDLAFAAAFLDASDRWRNLADLPSLLSGIATEAASILSADGVAVVQYTEDAQVLDVHLAADTDDVRTRELLRAAADEQWLFTPGSIPNLTLDRRWGDRGVRLAAAPWCSVLTVPLQPISQQEYRISWFSASPQAFSDQTGIAELFCRHADLALHQLNARENLTRGMNARHHIGLAQGILMARHQLTADQVFQVLLRESQNTNTKLNIVADRVIHSGRVSAGG